MCRKKQLVNCLNLFTLFTILITSLFVFIAIFSGNVLAADVYIDPTYSGTEQGTFDKPYNSWRDIVSFSASNNYRQKCGTTYSGYVRITTSGTSSNHIIIGAYYKSGGPVHEDVHPTFGATCGNSAAKPIIIGPTTDFATISIKAKYITVNSLELQKGPSAVNLKNNNNIVEYCVIGDDSRYGIRVGLSGDTNGDNNIIRYNIIDLKDFDKGPSVDCINLGSRSAYNEVYGNKITGCDHAGVFFENADYNKVFNNFIIDNKDVMGENILWNGNANYNDVHHNWCEGGLIQLQGGQHNKIYSNVITEADSSATAGHIILLNQNGYPTNYNKIYNNVINNSSGRGIMLYARAFESGGSVRNNDIKNNVVLSPANYCFFANDEAGELSGNIWKNNLCYGSLENRYAAINYSLYNNANAFNARPDAANNLDNNPGFKNPSAGQFWPDSANDSVVGNGYNLGSNYSQILNPDKTNFNASPPSVKTKSQPSSWFIGSYALPGTSIEVPPPSALKITQ